MHEFLKITALKSLEIFGINRLAARRHRNGMLVLGYHSILEKPHPQPFRYHHTVEEFQQHLEWLGRHCEPVGLDGLEQWFNGTWNHSKPPAVITFDDGYRNNATLAADMLTRMGLPAIFFLSSGYVGTSNVLWPDILFFRVVRWPQPEIRMPDGTSAALPTDAHKRETLAFHILQQAKDSPEQKRLEYLEYLQDGDPERNLRAAPEVQDFMSWEEARTLAQRGFELGSHTVTHPILSRIGPDQLRQELEQSRRTIEGATDARCIAIAYPNGQPNDYTPEVLAQVEQAGYRWGFIVSGQWNEQRERRFAIDRIVPPGHASAETFSFHVSGTRKLT